MKRYLMIALLLASAGCNDRNGLPAAKEQSAQANQPQSLPTITLPIGGRDFKLQVADDEDERRTGLMFRKSMPADEGMIFCFPSEAPRSFWMKNTPIDLDILYLDHTGKIVAIRTMHAYSQERTPSEADAMFAIELNAGVAGEMRLSVGQVLVIPPDLRDSAR